MMELDSIFSKKMMTKEEMIKRMSSLEMTKLFNLMVPDDMMKLIKMSGMEEQTKNKNKQEIIKMMKKEDMTNVIEKMSKEDIVKMLGEIKKNRKKKWQLQNGKEK